VDTSLTQCAYCHQEIECPTEPIMETREIIDNKVLHSRLLEVIEVTHRKCWIDMNKIIKDILQYSKDGHRLSTSLIIWNEEEK